MTLLSYDMLSPEQKLVGPGRTIGETDFSMGCMVTGDWHPVHCDAVFARDTPAGKPVLHGGYLTAIMLGMTAGLLTFHEPVVLLLGLEKWAFRAPVVAGDTLHLELTLHSKRRSSSGDRGILQFRQQLLNQRSEAVVEGISSHMVAGTGPGK
ncbi:MaoC/PaaZ C-terminal domain-containing protein [Vannielia litorea]|uniref:MaoC/PaaZ C-terminal domain-containing protein n=1 Tax=Vannielia litorea TaxID=1217970 RepID=UPI001BD171E2|nr:MaoC/PaaZ C-terminal domain-containing protein [Vannielia litorea]MBS8224672.1 dehydratase [Vannielia litorea]